MKSFRGITVRLATNEEPEALRDLAEKAEGVRSGGDWLDWSDVHPYWWVAEREGALLGMIQVFVSKPTMHMDRLMIDPSLGHRDKGIIARILSEAGVVTARSQGCSAISSMIPDALVSYQRVAERRGYLPIDHGIFVVRRIQ